MLKLSSRSLSSSAAEDWGGGMWDLAASTGDCKRAAARVGPTRDGVLATKAAACMRRVACCSCSSEASNIGAFDRLRARLNGLSRCALPGGHRWRYLTQPLAEAPLRVVRGGFFFFLIIKFRVMR